MLLAPGAARNAGLPAEELQSVLRPTDRPAAVAEVELEQVYRRYAQALQISPADLVDHQDPVVQVYQSLGRTRIINNSSY